MNRIEEIKQKVKNNDFSTKDIEDFGSDPNAQFDPYNVPF